MPAYGVKRRRSAVSLLAVPMLAGTMLTGAATAPPADAGRVQVSGDRFTSTGQQVTISVRLAPLEKGKLGITPPGGSKPVQVASGTGPKKLSYTMSLSCPDYDGSCVEDGRRVPAENGKWTVTFGSKVLVLGSGSESSFVVDAPPQRPSGLSADASTQRVAVRWRKGAEPDLSSYQVSVGGRSQQLPVSRACGGTSCSAALAAPSGGEAKVRVTAVRDGADGKLASRAAATAVTVPQPAKKPTAGGRPGTRGAAGGGSGSTAGGFPESGGSRGPGMPVGDWPSASDAPRSGPYPSFGVRPEVAPVKKSSRTTSRPMAEPVAYGQARGDIAVPVALGLVLVLSTWHLWLLTRSGRLRPALVRALGAARGRHIRSR